MNEKSSKEGLMIDMDRRTFMEAAGVAIAYAATVSAVPVFAESAPHEAPTTTMNLTVNGKVHAVTVEDRTTLLDAVRNQIGLTGTKKSCDRGECGACTVHIDGHRALACMTLAVMQKGRFITTIEGVANGSKLHPLQAAFIEHDGFQCGFCTPGQIMSGIALLKEARSGWPSAATSDVTRPFSYDQLSEAEIRERMSGNLCRCACYPNIVDSIASAAKEG
jgi:xanthine dehydrogenase YagT iron-sulfur-binding subunit